jgi:hypothetical protein
MPPPEPMKIKVNNFQLGDLEDSDAFDDSDYATSDTSDDLAVEEEYEQDSEVGSGDESVLVEIIDDADGFESDGDFLMSGGLQI